MNDKWMQNAFLFKDVDLEECKSLLLKTDVEYKRYEKGDCIFSPKSFEEKIGIVVSGKCEVLRCRSEGDGIPLNILSVGDAFGVVAAFAGCAEFPTEIIAQRSTEIAFFTKESIYLLMEQNIRFSINIINFLANRIAFLNTKISSFSGDNVEQKLAKYILNEYKARNDVCIKFNKKHAAEALNSGRTSIYRALDGLASERIICLDEKSIIILDLEGLERKTK